MMILLFLLAVTMAAGQTEKPVVVPCETMLQWEGRASEWDHLDESNNRFIVSYDGIGQRKWVKEERKSFMPGRRFYQYIMEYKTNTLYTIMEKYQKCTVTTLSQPWQNHTIPADATMEDEYEIGPPGSGFMVREWSDRLPARRAENWIGVFTVEGCWPVVEVFTYDDETHPVSLTTRFFDFSPGIKDVSVFTPPSYCGKKYDPLETDTVNVIKRGWNYLKTWL